MSLYLWVKAIHVMAIISWMAAMLYLPRLFVYHTGQEPGSDAAKTFEVMEAKLLRVIMNPAMIATWVFGLIMVATPGIIDWSQIWPWLKAACVLAMTWFHHWCGQRRKDFEAGRNDKPGRYFRMMNEVPTVLMIVIVVSVIVRPF